MYKKFLSITLLVSLVHALCANELESTIVDTVESNEPIVATDSEVKEQIASVNEAREVQEGVSALASAEEQAVEVVKNDAISEIIDEIATIEEQISALPHDIKIEEEVAQGIEAVSQEHVVEETSIVATEHENNELSFGLFVTPKAAQMLNGFSDAGSADFNDFGIELGVELLKLPDVKDFISKHEAIYAQYKAFKGEVPKISVDFFISDEYADICTKLDENNAKFVETLSAEDALKFEQTRIDLADFLRTALEFTLSKIATRKFPLELINVDKNQELLVNVRVD